MPSKRKAKSTEDREEDLTNPSAPTQINPYTVLSLPRTATQDEIKSAYRRAALKTHPDKAPPEEKEAANTKFQELAFAYAILSDERRRKRYDTTGRTEESLDADEEDGGLDWASFYREQYAEVVTLERIDAFREEYQGSEEERRHVLEAYEEVRGDMGKLYSRVMLSEVLEDEERFRGIIDQAIRGGEVKAYPKYVNETVKAKEARMKKARKEREKEARALEEAEKAEEEEESEEEGGKAKKRGKKAKANGGTNDLAALIQQRQQSRAENFFDNLEEKYAPKSKAKKGAKRPLDEPSEEAFAKNRENGKSKKAKR